MKNLALTTATVGLLTMAGLGFAGAATAAPTMNRSAEDVIAQLEADGHTVHLNGSSNYPLKDCKATGVHGLRGSHTDDEGRLMDQDQLSTVYVDVTCRTE